MTKLPPATLKTVQIRYRIDYLTWLRMKAWGQQQEMSPSEACQVLLFLALNEQGVADDPVVLLGLEEKDDG